MTRRPTDSRDALDVRIDNASREGLTGTAPAERYGSLIDLDQVTRAPDWRPLDEQPAWRQDFPIDAPQDQHVARRDFMKFMVLTSAGFAAGQIWIGVQNWFRKRRGQEPIAKVTSLQNIPVGSSLTFAYPGANDRCLLVRPSEDAVVAYGQECTHVACAVVPEIERGRLRCPCHEGFFDLDTGRPIAGPPRRPLTRVTLDVRGDTVYATGVELRTV